MLAIFDIDGTICDTQDVEGRCFAQASEEILGVSLETLDWTLYDEPTSSAIAQSVLANNPHPIAKERRFRDRFVTLLAEAQPKFPGDFSPIRGAHEFIAKMSTHPEITVAFATGGFDAEAAFKLKCCGLDLSEYPHATSSDTPRRRDIIPLAAQRAGFDLSSAVYFADAPWDVEAAARLSLPMIGIGRRIGELGKMGVKNRFRDFSQSDAILDAFYTLNRTRRRHGG